VSFLGTSTETLIMWYNQKIWIVLIVFVFLLIATMATGR
jgi:hypothetical protein